MLTKLKTVYKTLPYKYRLNLSKIIWHIRHINAHLYRIIRFIGLIRMPSKRVSWIIEGDLFCFNQKKIEGKNFLLFPVIDWDFRIQRPQHISREIANIGNMVIYFTTYFNLAEMPGFKIEKSPVTNLIICSLNLNKEKNIYADTLSKDDVSFLLQSVNAVRASFNLGHTYSIVNLPFWSDVTNKLPGNTVIYDCMDHHAGFENNSIEMLSKEIELLKSADLVITTAKTLSDKISKIRDNTIIRNAAEIGFFSKLNHNVIYDKKDKTIVGYYGAVAEWFDLDLLSFLAINSPDIEFVIAGDVTVDIKHLEKHLNIKFIGEVLYRDLTAYLNSFDVCIIPFKIIDLTICTNPVKIYEYLAAGKPVISTAMPEVELISDYVHIGNTKEEFLAKIQDAISEKDNMDLALFRKNWALQHDWSSRAKELCKKIFSIEIFPKKVSLIVLTYNNIELTKQCLDSIVKNTTYKNYEVIIVDNNSTDGTQEYLTNKYQNNDIFNIILNECNLGFAAGNNIGLMASQGEILLILNNDTYVTPYWLEPLISVLNENYVGLVCPVTNNIGNEAKVNVSYDSFNDMNVQALNYTCSHMGNVYPMKCIAFFCVAMRRDLYESIGPLSEEYGLGFFEDDDYCMRVLKAGYKNYAVDGSFVHHHLSASFNQLKNNTKEELMLRNKKMFESKWGQWIPHSYRKGVY